MNFYAQRQELIIDETLSVFEKISAAHYKGNGETATTLVQGPGAYFKGYSGDRKRRLKVESQFQLLREKIGKGVELSDLRFKKIDHIPVRSIVSALHRGPINATGLHWCTMKRYMENENLIPMDEDPIT